MLNGWDGRFKMRCWPDGAGRDRPCESAGDDLAALRAKAVRLIGEGACSRIELSAWSFELNDWVRMERFEAD